VIAKFQTDAVSRFTHSTPFPNFPLLGLENPVIKPLASQPSSVYVSKPWISK
jgi:hypothetical protein